MKKSVAIVYNQVGDDTYEKIREVDPESLDFTPEYPIHVATVQDEYDAIVKALRAEGFRARTFNTEESLTRLHRLITRHRPDVVFNLIEFFHNDPSMECPVAGLFDLYRIPYTGASYFGLSICRRKGLTKQILLQNDIATPAFRMLDDPRIERDHRLHYPLIVKPGRQDASSGVESRSVVHDYDQLLAQLDRVNETFKPPFLVEEFLEGKELHVALLGNAPPRVLPIAEFNFSELPPEHPPLITYDVKWNPLSLAYHRVHSQCPAEIDKETEDKVKTQAVLAFKATSCRDYARIDIRLGPGNTPYVLEVNPNPDLTEGVSFMESAEKAGLGFAETLRMIVDYALERRSAAQLQVVRGALHPLVAEAEH